MSLELEKQFTRVFRQYKTAHPAIREAECLKVLYPSLLPPIEQEDYFAGRTLLMEWKGVGFSPDVTLYSLPHGMGYFYREKVFQEALDVAEPGSLEACELQDMMRFWEKENTTAKVKEHFTPEIRSFFPSDSFAGEVGVGFPLYRMTGAYENYGLLVREGLPGLKRLVEERRRMAREEQKDFYKGLLMVLQLVEDCCVSYAEMAREQMKTASPQRKERLAKMAEDLLFLKKHAPETLCQAIQLSWLYSCLAGVMDYGRMDVYLGDFLARDLASGTLTEQSAQEALCGFWRMMVARKTVYHGRVVIGGTGRPNEQNADRFAMMAMEASAIVHGIEPQLTLRFYRGQDPKLMEKALDVIGQGTTYPMLYNDDVNVPAVMHAFRLEKEDADQYVPFGCGEYIIDHKGFGSPNAVINLLKALEVTLFNGKEIVKNRPMGLALGSLTDFVTFDALYDAYKQQLTRHIELLADAEATILRQTARQAPFLLMSLLYDGCIEQGKSMLDGAIPYLGATLESYGNINTVDSLAAIRWAVYDQKLLTAERLMEALRANFKGYEKEQSLLRRAPKYGNDDPYVDDLAVDLHDFEAKTVRAQAERVGLHSFLMVVINNSANTYLGRWTGASADGRNAGTFMANANNPMGGADRSGVTAMLNTLARFPAENHAGVVQNLKFSPALFNRSREKLSALLQAYFDNGGTQTMITVVGRRDLENALQHPEQYQSLMVRVGGFSARFVELEKDVQQEVLSRTCY